MKVWRESKSGSGLRLSLKLEKEMTTLQLATVIFTVVILFQGAGECASAMNPLVVHTRHPLIQSARPPVRPLALRTRPMPKTVIVRADFNPLPDKKITEQLINFDRKARKYFRRDPPGVQSDPKLVETSNFIKNLFFNHDHVKSAMIPARFARRQLLYHIKLDWGGDVMQLIRAILLHKIPPSAGAIVSIISAAVRSGKVDVLRGIFHILKKKPTLMVGRGDLDACLRDAVRLHHWEVAVELREMGARLDLNYQFCDYIQFDKDPDLAFEMVMTGVVNTIEVFECAGRLENQFKRYRLMEKLRQKIQVEAETEITKPLEPLKSFIQFSETLEPLIYGAANGKVEFIKYLWQLKQAVYKNLDLGAPFDLELRKKKFYLARNITEKGFDAVRMPAAIDTALKYGQTDVLFCLLQLTNPEELDQMLSFFAKRAVRYHAVGAVEMLIKRYKMPLSEFDGALMTSRALSAGDFSQFERLIYLGLRPSHKAFLDALQSPSYLNAFITFDRLLVAGYDPHEFGGYLALKEIAAYDGNEIYQVASNYLLSRMKLSTDQIKELVEISLQASNFWFLRGYGNEFINQGVPVCSIIREKALEGDGVAFIFWLRFVRRLDPNETREIIRKFRFISSQPRRLMFIAEHCPPEFEEKL